MRANHTSYAERFDYIFPKGKRKVTKRHDRKSHGVASFQEITGVVANEWRSIDDATLEYCTTVAKILKQRHNEIKEMGSLGCFAAVTSSESSNSIAGHFEISDPKIYQPCSTTAIPTMSIAKDLTMMSLSAVTPNLSNVTRQASYSNWNYYCNDEAEEAIPSLVTSYAYIP